MLWPGCELRKVGMQIIMAPMVMATRSPAPDGVAVQHAQTRSLPSATASDSSAGSM